MAVFTFLDWFWVGLFLLLMLGSGILFYRLGKRSESDFFLAGRGLPWWLPASSVYATHTATDTPMWITGVIYKNGMAGIWYTFFCGWAAISAFVSTRIFRRSLAYHTGRMECRTLHRPRQRIATRLDGWMAILHEYVCARLGWYRYGTCVRVPVCLANLDRTGSFFPSVCHLCSGCRILGVVMADFQQGVIAFLVIIIVSVWGIHIAGGPTGILDKLAALGELDRINPFAFTGWWSGDFPIAWFITMMMIAFLGGFGMGTTIDWYVEAQRIQSAKTVRDASYSIWWGTIIGLVRNSVWAVAILAFFVLFPAITDPSEYEMGWFRLGFDYLPAGMLGFFFAPS